MPISREQMKQYPANWKSEIVPNILRRANFRCEACGLHRYSVGYRDADGAFMPMAGSGPCDAAGWGKSWPGLKPLTYAEAREFADHANCSRVQGKRGGWSKPCDDDGNRWFVIVLTCAHLDRTGAPGPGDGPLDCADDRLKMLCQSCHLSLDAERHKAKRAATLAARQAKAAQVQPALLEAA